jgi:hypothetical protein
VPSTIATSGTAVADLTPIGTSAVTGELAGNEAGNLSGPIVMPPAYGGIGCEDGGCYWYDENEMQKTAIGMEYSTNISEPHVSSFSGAHSIDQLAVGAGPGLNTYTMEAGFDVDPGFGWSSPANPHFFMFVNKDQNLSVNRLLMKKVKFTTKRETATTGAASRA